MNQLQAMRTFVRVADLESFTRAAEALGLARGAVSAQIRALERHLSVALLSRTTRRVTLTSDGAAYLARSRRILAEVDEADSEMQRYREQVRGRLRVDMPAMFGRYLFLPALPAFAARYPDLSLEVQYNDRVIDLGAERVDVAVRFSKTTDPNLISRPIGRAKWVTCATPDYLARHGTPASVDDLRAHKLIGQVSAATGRSRDWGFRIGGQPRRLALPCALRFNSIEGTLQAALSGLGIVQTADLIVRDLIRRQRLVQVLPGTAAAGSPVTVVYQRAGRTSARVRVFADFIAETFRQWDADYSAPVFASQD